MRCPDCSKFVSMETGDPEVNSLEAEFSDGSIRVSSDVRVTRNCADCGTELKDHTYNPEDTIELAQFDAWQKLSESQRQALVKAGDAGDLEIEIEETGSSVDESGGSRYKANEITLTLDYQITVKGGGLAEPITFDGSLQEMETAGAFDECC